MAERSILVNLKASISDLQSKLRQAAADTAALGKAAEQANQRSASSSSKVASAEKRAAAEARLRAGVRRAAAEDEIRSNERLRISAEKYGKATATVLQHKDTIDKVGRSAGAAGTVVAAGVGLAIAKFAEFDRAMSGVAATGSDARVNLTQLRQAAVDAGAATQYSATEAAAGVEALLKAGVSAKDVLGGGLSGALSLAAAGNLDVGQSAEVAASAMNQFGLSGNKVGHIADLLAAGAGNAQGEVSDMAQALNQAGLIASQTGLSIEDTVGTLTAFGKAGLVGSDAGTSFKTMLQSLIPNSKEAAAAMRDIGLKAYDSQGNFVGITKVAGQLQAGLGKLSVAQQNAALKTIFGSDAVRAANILYKQGATGLKGYIDSVNQQGYAADVAAIKMDNLSGDIEGLKGALDSAFIGAGSGGNTFLRGLTQDATGAVRAFNQLSPATQQNTLKVAALGAGALLGVAGLSKLVVGAAEAKAVLTPLAGRLKSSAAGAVNAAGGYGKLAGGLAVATAAFIGLQELGDLQDKQSAKLAVSSEDARSGLIRLATTSESASAVFDSSFSGVIEGVDGIGDAFNLLHGKAGFIEEAGTKFFDFTSAIAGAKGPTQLLQEQMTKLDGQLVGLPVDQAATAFQKFSTEIGDVPVDDLVGAFPLYRDALKKTANDLQVTTLTAQDYADWMGGKVPAAITAAANTTGNAGKTFAGIRGPIKGATTDLGALVKAAQAYANSSLFDHAGRIGVEQSIDDAARSAKTNGKGLDLNTQKGRNNQGSLDKIVSQTNAYTAALVKQGDSADKVNRINERGRAGYVRNAVAMGKNREVAERLSTELFRLPKNVHPTVALSGAKLSAADARSVNRELKSIPKSKRAEIVTIAQTQGARAAKKAMAEIKARKVEARILGNIDGATAVKRAQRELHDRLVKAITRGDTSGAQRVADALGRLHDKTVNIYTKEYSSKQRATGHGLVRATGGKLDGPGTETSDDIPLWGSKNEWMIKASSSRYYGDDVMGAINAGVIPKDAFAPYGFKDGGKLGHIGLALAAGGKVDDGAAILKIVAKEVNPLHDIEAARRDIAEAKRDRRRADTHKERVKADHELTAATKKLTEAQKAAAETAKQAAATLSDPYRSQSHDLKDWVEQMQQGAADLKLFNTEIGQLRKLGVSEDVIKQITDRGATVGIELAQQLLGEGGKDLAKTLNQANTDLQNAANQLGVVTTTGKPKGHYLGGLHVGPGSGTSDSILTRVSNGEWTVPQRNVGSNLHLLQAMTYGPTGPVRPAYAGSLAAASVVHNHADTHLYAGDTRIEGVIGDPDRWLRKAAARKRDTITMAGLRRAL